MKKCNRNIVTIDNVKQHGAPYSNDMFINEYNIDEYDNEYTSVSYAHESTYNEHEMELDNYY